MSNNMYDKVIDNFNNDKYSKKFSKIIEKI